MAPMNRIVITEFDHTRLDQLLEGRRRAGLDSPNLDELEMELERAQVVKPTEVPANVVTMNTEVQLVDLDKGDKLSLTVVFPKDADIHAGRISVLAPMGLALLGCRESEEVEWQTPSRKRRLRIERIVFQPEASGQFDL